MSNGKTKIKSVRFPHDMAARIEEIAKRERRSFGQVVNLILEEATQDYDTTGTQFSMPATDAEREQLMERMR